MQSRGVLSRFFIRTTGLLYSDSECSMIPSLSHCSIWSSIMHRSENANLRGRECTGVSSFKTIRIETVPKPTRKMFTALSFGLFKLMCIVSLTMLYLLPVSIWAVYLLLFIWISLHIESLSSHTLRVFFGVSTVSILPVGQSFDMCQKLLQLKHFRPLFRLGHWFDVWPPAPQLKQCTFLCIDTSLWPAPSLPIGYFDLSS